MRQQDADHDVELVERDQAAAALGKATDDVRVVATLTGGVVIALGDACAGLWCDNDKLRQRLLRFAPFDIIKGNSATGRFALPSESASA